MLNVELKSNCWNGVTQPSDMLTVILCISPTLQTCQSCSCCFLPGTPPSPHLVNLTAMLWLCEIFGPPLQPELAVPLAQFPLFSVDPSLDTPFHIYCFPYIPFSSHTPLYILLFPYTLYSFHCILFSFVPLYLATPFPGYCSFRILLSVYSFLYIISQWPERQKEHELQNMTWLELILGLINSLPMWVWVCYLIFSSFLSKMILISPRFSPPAVNDSLSPVGKA